MKRSKYAQHRQLMVFQFVNNLYVFYGTLIHLSCPLKASQCFVYRVSRNREDSDKNSAISHNRVCWSSSPDGYFLARHTNTNYSSWCTTNKLLSGHLVSVQLVTYHDTVLSLFILREFRLVHCICLCASFGDFITNGASRYKNILCPVQVKVKINITLEQATKTQRGSTGIALLFP